MSEAYGDAVPEPHVQSPGRGLLLASGLVVVASLAALPIAEHWNARGGEEWWTALVLGAAGACTLRGLAALFKSRTRSWGVGLIAGAALGLVLVFGAFLVYFVGLRGS